MKKRLVYKVRNTDISKKNKEIMEVEVELKERKYAFGKTFALITPVSGTGEIWVKESNLIVK